MRLVEQWEDLQRTLPPDWATARLALEVDAADQERAERLLATLPHRSETRFEIELIRSEEPFGATPALLRRLLGRLDADGVRGRLSVASADLGEAGARPRLALEWDRLLERLPDDWSHLLAEVELDSSDFVERGALLLAPANPARFEGGRTFQFRAARLVGYGVAATMARRCLTRLDEQSITGRLRLLRVISDDRPVATQGPVWRVGGRAV